MARFSPLWVLFLMIFPCPSLGLNIDGVLLLSFKYSVVADPLSVLSDWSYDDDTPCSWNGVMCIAIPRSSNHNVGDNANVSMNSRVISLVLPDSQLLGSIPLDLGHLDHLRHLDLSDNYLNGTLPTSLFNASELRILSLTNNDISGELPQLDPNRLGALQVLNLSDNALVGRVPGNLTLLPNLTVLSLANNYLSGNLTGGGFDRLEVMDLSSNLVNGSVPADLGGGRLRYLNLSYNRLDGGISGDLGSRVPAGFVLDLSFNNLTGQIPQSRAFLSQKSLSFAGNPDLCGRPLRHLCSISSTLSHPPNVSVATPKSAPAIAAIPRKPNGGTAEGPRRSAGQGGLRPAAIVAITIGDLGVIGLLFIVFLYVFHVKRKRRLQQQQQQQQQKSMSMSKAGNAAEKPPASPDVSRLNDLSCCLRKKGGDSGETSETTDTEEEEEDQNQVMADAAAAAAKSEAQQKRKGGVLVTVDGGEMDLEVETLLKASAYILGATASSIVYKAVLADGTALAVRRIGENSAAVVYKLKDFEAQVRSIAKFRHPNLLPLRGFYWGTDEKLLIHDYAPNGSLANISFSKKLGSSPFHLSWVARVRIARGVARGLAYLHEKKSLHGNIKPSNILIGEDMEPWIGDFGLDRLGLAAAGDSSSNPGMNFGSKRSTQSLPEMSFPAAGASPSTASTASAAPPYQAPESLKNLKLKPNPKWDVYSFGMVLLELVAGRVFSEAELCHWNAGFVVEERNRVLRMADSALHSELEGKEEDLLLCFKLGFSCASVAPQRRPSIKDAVQLLDRLVPSAS